MLFGNKRKLKKVFLSFFLLQQKMKVFLSMGRTELVKRYIEDLEILLKKYATQVKINVK